MNLKEKNDDKNILKEFALWIAAKYGMPISEKLIEAEVEAFFKDRKAIGKKEKKTKEEKMDYHG